MSKSILFNIETQSEKGEAISICHVNEKSIALETSYIASKMFKKNRALYNKINEGTKIIGGAVYRQEVLRAKISKNRVSVIVDDKYEHSEVEIAQLVFKNGIMQKRQRAMSKNETYFDFDPNNISGKTGGKFDPNNPSIDDVREAEMLSTCEEMHLFQSDGIKTFMISDAFPGKKDLLEVGYKIHLVVSSNFEEYYEFLLNKAEKSLLFLTNYTNSLSELNRYDGTKREFKEEFSKTIFEQLGISDVEGKIDLASNRIRNSEFGQVALDYYNLLLMVDSMAKKKIYASILNTLLPTRKTTPSSISRFLFDFSSLLQRVRMEYSLQGKESRKEKSYSRIQQGKILNNTIEATTKEYIEMEKDRLGYSLFSDNQSGLNKFTIGDYRKRIGLEQAKYYPSIAVEDSSTFLTNTERVEFARLDNAPAFLTPASMIMGSEKISTSRGMKNIPIDKIRQFRLAKSSRALQANMNKRALSLPSSKITNNIVSSFNITIAPPVKTLLARSSREEIDPLIDSRYYVGEGSTFSTNNTEQLIRTFKRMLTKDEKRVLSIVSDIVPRRFLRKSKAIKSIKEIQFSNPNSKVRRLASTNELKIGSIPPHVKFMMSEAFNPNPASDPMKNSESREIIEETQKNLFIVKALVGFGVDEEGLVNLSDPIYKEMSNEVLSQGRPVLAKAFNYEIQELGIVKDNFTATIYNNLTYIKG